MNTSQNRTSAGSRVRAAVWPFVLIGASFAVLAAISASPGTSQNRSDISTAMGDTPTPTPRPTPSCSPPCSVAVVYRENFDNLTPPVLPPAWLATNALGPPPLWTTSNSGVPTPPADSPPNAVFIDDPGVVSDKRLDSSFFPGPTILSPEQPLEFWHNFNLEASEVDETVGYDGGALEVSTDGGNTFQDILDAGGAFIGGGYNRTISTDRGSPIAGRHAWSGNSGGFIRTGITLPFIPQSLKLRWRMVSDTVGAGEGWRVDSIYAARCIPFPCETPTPPPTPPIRLSPTPRVHPTPWPRPTSH